METTSGMRVSEDQVQRLTDWANEPTLQNLKHDLQTAQNSHSHHVTNFKRWEEVMKAKGPAPSPGKRARSRVQPKLARKQAEWRYAPLSEPFLSSDKLFRVKPDTFEDGPAARQNELLLNHQWKTKLRRVKFIDRYVRATVNQGTSITRVGWLRQTKKVQEEAPVFQYTAPQSQEQLQQLEQAIQSKKADPRTFNENSDPLIKAAVEYWEETGQAAVATQIGVEMVTVEKVIINRPTVEVLNPLNVYIDPACGDDFDKALFVVISFETTKAELLREPKKYSAERVNQINFEDGAVTTVPDHATNTPHEQTHDTLRKRVVAFEYWGFYDINNDGDLQPVVITWIGNTIVRAEINPFPDGKIPLVIVPYMPTDTVYGEPDAELLEDNQKIMGATTRGMIDLLGRSANSQQGMAKGMLDPLNKKRFDSGEDYEYNPIMPMGNGLIEHKYPEIPQSAIAMLTLQNQEAESLTGVKSFSGGLSGEAFGEVAAGVRGVLDSAGKREMSILRRLADGIIEIGRKIAMMNGEFLSEEETVRITNDEFVKIRRDELAGGFDLDIDIATAEVDQARAADLAFVFQTIGPDMDMEMTKLVLSELMELKRMPELAEKIRNLQPKVDPVAQKMQELQIMELELKIQEIQSKIRLNNARAEEALADADNASLDFVKKETGRDHAEELERQRAQAEGNQNLVITKALASPRKEGERDPDIEAAVGFTELSNGRRNIGQNAEDIPLTSPQTGFNGDFAPTGPGDELIDQALIAG